MPLSLAQGPRGHSSTAHNLPCLAGESVATILRARDAHIQQLSDYRARAIEVEQALSPAFALQNLRSTMDQFELWVESHQGFSDVLLRLERCQQIARGEAVRFLTAVRETRNNLAASQVRLERRQQVIERFTREQEVQRSLSLIEIQELEKRRANLGRE